MVVEELEVLKHVRTVKEHNIDNGLQKARKIMISVSYFLI